MHSIVASASLWTPRRLNPIAWYRADLGVTLVGSKVSAWADQSGNGNHLAQSTDALRPTYVASVATRGNCPAVDTAGSTYVEGTITLPREVAFVVAVGATGSGYVLTHGSGSTEYHYFYSGGPATFYVRRTTSDQYYRTVNTHPALVANTNHIAQYDGSAITLRRAGVDVAMSAPSGAILTPESISSTLRLGVSAAGGSGAGAEWLELIICAPLTAPQLAALDAYFARLGRPN